MSRGPLPRLGSAKHLPRVRLHWDPMECHCAPQSPCPWLAGSYYTAFPTQGAQTFHFKLLSIEGSEEITSHPQAGERDVSVSRGVSVSVKVPEWATSHRLVQDRKSVV